MFESCRFRRFRGQTLRLSILLDAGRRPALRNICKIAKFVDTAENEPKEVFLIWKCFIFRIHCLAVYGPAIFLFSLCDFTQTSRFRSVREIAIILQTVHALLRDPLRGGRGDFTEIKFDQIRSRCDKFGDFFAKILSFEGIFKVYFLSCFQNLFTFPIFCRMSAIFVSF